MNNLRTALLIGATLFASAMATSGTVAAAPPAQGAAPAPEVEAKPHRVAVIGASASAGFGCVLQERREDGTYVASFRLADMLRLTCPELPLVTTDSSSGFFFNRPVEYGTRAVSRAISFGPDAVVALDFLFWYCYGNDDATGQRLDGEEERLEKFERGLAELARLEVPVLVGDLPDMSPAVGRMLAASQMPAAPTLARCNDRLREWARARPNVVLLPLAEMQAGLMRDGTLEVAGTTLRATADAPLLQRDRLHPTPAGLAGLACAVADALATALATEPPCAPDPAETLAKARATAKRLSDRAAAGASTPDAAAPAEPARPASS